MQKNLLDIFQSHPAISKLKEGLSQGRTAHLLGAKGSSIQLLACALQNEINCKQLFIVDDKEEAAYFLNDLEQLLGEKNVLFFFCVFEGQDFFDVFGGFWSKIVWDFGPVHVFEKTQKYQKWS